MPRFISGNVLKCLATLTERNNDYFSNLFVLPLVDMLQEKKDMVDHTFLQVLLHVRNVFLAFQKTDELVLPYLALQAPLLNEA